MEINYYGTSKELLFLLLLNQMYFYSKFLKLLSTLYIIVASTVYNTKTYHSVLQQNNYNS